MVELGQLKTPAVMRTLRGVTEQLGAARCPNLTPNWPSLSTLASGALAASSFCRWMPSIEIVTAVMVGYPVARVALVLRTPRIRSPHEYARGNGLDKIQNGTAKKPEFGGRRILNGNEPLIRRGLKRIASGYARPLSDGHAKTLRRSWRTTKPIRRKILTGFVPIIRNTAERTSWPGGCGIRTTSRVSIARRSHRSRRNNWRRKSPIGVTAAGSVKGHTRRWIMSSRLQKVACIASRICGPSVHHATRENVIHGRLRSN